MNPLSVGVIMLTLLDEDISKSEVRATANKSMKAVFVSMLVLFLNGSYIFQFFGISPHGLRVFGGLILLIMGINMVQGHGKRVNHSSGEHTAAMERDDISVVPLAIPIMVGPGLATTLINLSINATGWIDYVSSLIAIIICSIASLIIMQRMPFIKRKLGTNGLKVFNRLMGLVVGSLAAQMILKGILGLYELFNAA